MGNCWRFPIQVHSPTLSNPNSTFTLSPPPLVSNNNNNRRDAGKRKEEVEGSGHIVTPNLKMFSFRELKKATHNFKPDSVVGEGGFGRVFKAWVDENTFLPSKPGVGMLVAVKKSNPDSSQGLKEWQAEVKFLGKFSHRNLVKLLGYCWEEKQFLLVYEYMHKGSLENHLFKKNIDSLSWETRINIAIGAARGLAFLHTTEKQVIYRDFKASNILLDVDFNAKLSDFGLAKLGPMNGNSHVTTGIVGTYGYAAPEYVATGHLYVKSDVYGYGVVLLEILTGLRVVDLERPSGQHNLITWAVPSLSDKRRLKKIIDPKLGNKYPLKGAFQAAQIVLQCLEPDPKNRPSMEEILVNLEQISAIKKKEEANENRGGLKISKSADNFQKKHNRSPLHKKYGGSEEIGARGQVRPPLQRSS